MGQKHQNRQSQYAKPIEDLWKYAQSIDNDDELNPELTDFKEISKEVIEKTVAKKMPSYLETKKPVRSQKPNCATSETIFVANLEKYEQQNKLF